eukprot:TRINITY_DN1471_c0_g1_i3.p1 TRINITY_DN1471_c0_g1~~TRINITY_DN1471_c0_g1_i3.p1  ORF type:complete len:114 (-),score=2.01 TRINITY_DN1471_c0_g1_i3:264-560(-)
MCIRDRRCMSMRRYRFSVMQYYPPLIVIPIRITDASFTPKSLSLSLSPTAMIPKKQGQFLGAYTNLCLYRFFEFSSSRGSIELDHDFSNISLYKHVLF